MDLRDIETLERETQGCIWFSYTEPYGENEFIAWCCGPDGVFWDNMEEFMKAHNCVDCKCFYPKEK